jgi:predicted transcriptional regulator of viral defense system
METIQIVKKLEEYPTFNIDAFANIIDNDETYAKVFLNRLKNRGIVKQIQRNVYTVQEDPLIIASRIIWPSYISLWAAFRYHNLTEQIPSKISVITARSKSRKNIQMMNTTIIFEKIRPSWFFGFSKINIQDFEVFMAEPEKALIDAVLLKKNSTAEIYFILKENIKDISTKKIVDYILRTENHALAKRFGWMLESLGCKYVKRLKKQTYKTMIPLDITRPITGLNDKKWGVVVNIGEI